MLVLWARSYWQYDIFMSNEAYIGEGMGIHSSRGSWTVERYYHGWKKGSDLPPRFPRAYFPPPSLLQGLYTVACGNYRIDVSGEGPAAANIPVFVTGMYYVQAPHWLIVL